MKPIRPFLAALLVALGATVRADLPGPAANAKAPPLADAEEKLEPGLTLTFKGSSGGLSDSRTARMVSLYVPDGVAPTPFLPPGPFKATWTGNFVSRIRDTVTLSAAGRGALKVTLNDQPALATSGDDLTKTPGKPTQLKKGKNKLTVEYASPDKGPSELRLFWSSDTFAPEPVPPTSFSHETSDKDLRTHARLRDGRTLLADLRCLRCHAPTDKLPDSAMPELSTDAPNLSDAGSRLNQPFIAAWIQDPKKLRPQARMPRLHLNASQSNDIAAYLATLGAKSTAPVTGDAALGARTFTTLGCIACHTPPDSDKPDPQRIPLNITKSKWQPAALVAYLKAPERTYAWTRMPNFRLSDAEAMNLAAYLLTKSPDAPAATERVAGDPKKGDALFHSSGCSNCHTAETAEKGDAAHFPSLADLTTKSDWTTGCLAKDDAARKSAPDFSLSDDQRAALQSLAAAGLSSLSRDNPIETAGRLFAAANCSACHLRDNTGDTWSDLKEEIAAIEATLPPAPDTGEKYAPDQSRPVLTWVGEKLKPDWMAHFIAGHIPYKPRPYIQARMPGFATRAPLIAAGFANEHGYSADPVTEPAPDPALIPLGQKLVGKTGGFSCINCHPVASAPALAPFEAPAPNFAHVKDRLRHDYYLRWVRNPQRVEPGTRMPTFPKPDGTTAIKDVLAGDAAKQFNAIWNYLLQGENLQPPQQ